MWAEDSNNLVYPTHLLMNYNWVNLFLIFYVSNLGVNAKLVIKMIKNPNNPSSKAKDLLLSENRIT